MPFFTQLPEASVSVPEISGSLPEVSGDVSMPSVGGGMDVDVAAPSIDVDASLPSASGKLPGECKSFGCECFSIVLLFVAYWVTRGIFFSLVCKTCFIWFEDAGLYFVLAPRSVF